MKLSDLLQENLIYADLKSRRKKKALAEIVGFLVEHQHYACDPDKLLCAVMEREKIKSTGIGCGIAIAHGITDAVDKIACALAISHDGVEYDAIDKKPVHFIFLVTSPPAESVNYLSLLAAICRVFEDENIRVKVIESRSPAEILSQIKRNEEVR